jgi:hypothetical protein
MGDRKRISAAPCHHRPRGQHIRRSIIPLSITSAKPTTFYGSTFTSGCAAQNNLFGDQKFWRTKYLEAYKKHIPLKSLRFGVTFAACATANRCAKKSLLSQAKL